MRLEETCVGEGVTVRHVETGTGPPLVMLPGWSQTAAMFAPQIEALAERFTVIALDHRGHGESDRPSTGPHLHRLAADLHDVLRRRDLRDVRLLGHSMGCAVIWSYLELYGPGRLTALVLVDQMPCALRDPAWDDEECAVAGASLDADALFAFAFARALRGDGPDPREGFLRAVTSDGLGDDRLDWLAEQNRTMDRGQAADLLMDVATRDWRAQIETIRLPTLIVAGGSPNVPDRSQRWMAERIAGARYARIEGVSGGTHFPFVESPARFNREVADFLAGEASS